MNKQNDFKDILAPRNEEFGFISFATRTLDLKKSMEINKDCTPQDVKYIAANSAFLGSVIEAESIKTGVCKEELKQQVIKYLDEMASSRNLYSARLIMYAILRTSSILKLGLIVNETQMLKIRVVMGKTPLLFLPTHRSYVDTVLLFYLCFQYDIEFPATAAGINIGRMAVIGKLLRDLNAFYIRRTLNGAPLYEATLRQYVYTLVTSYNTPLEFFVEGTRSRSNKSMAPKYGMLSMILTPIFTQEVNDILLTPVHISYDRLVDQLPFVYEHLGVPKAKENTMSLIRALLSSNDIFGNIYINIGTPFSANSYPKGDSILCSNETLTPLKNQQITAEQFKEVKKIGDHIITLQQKLTVTNVANLIAAVLMGSLMQNKPLTIDESIGEVKWMMDVLQNLGALVLLNDVEREVERILVVHMNMMIVDDDRKLKLVASSKVSLPDEVKSKMKGHALKDETLVNALPLIQLQLYVNPVLHYFVPAGLILALTSGGGPTEEKMAADWRRIRRLVKYEFFYNENDDDKTFSNALEYCIENRVITKNNGSCDLGADERLQFLLKWTIWPALTMLLKCADAMTELKKCEQKKALKAIQEQVEMSECHPYCLSLDVAANCLKGLVLDGALLVHKGDDTIYELVPAVMSECRQLIERVIPKFDVKFGRSNGVIHYQEVLI